MAWQTRNRFNGFKYAVACELAAEETVKTVAKSRQPLSPRL